MSEITNKFTIKENLIKYTDEDTILELDLNDACRVLNAYHECWSTLLALIHERDKELYEEVNTELIDRIFLKLIKGGFKNG